MLSGDNSILQKATEAKTRTERATIIESAQTDILGQQAENKGANITKEQLSTILNKYFKTVVSTSIPDNISTTNDIELTTIDEKYKINLSEIYNGILSGGKNLKIGDVIINYTSNTALPSGINWIYFGTDAQGHKLLTTSQPISNSCTLNCTPEEWLKLEDDDGPINSACNAYTGTGAIEARSITIEDINRVLGLNLSPTTFYFKSGDNDYEHNQMNYYYPSKTAENYWQAPTSTAQEITMNSYFYYLDNNTVYYSGIDNNFEDTDITNNINMNNLKYVIGENSDFYYVTTSRCFDMNVFGEDSGTFGCARVNGQYVFAGNNPLQLCGSDANGGQSITAWGGGIASEDVDIRPIIVLPNSFTLDTE